ncbi:unnamed protein product, partial [Ectocarpus sp. 8 AP-2014]
AESVRRFSVGDGSGGGGGGGGGAAAAAAAGGSGVGKMPASTTECGSGSGSGGGGDRYVRVAGPHVTAFLRTALLMVHICMQPPSPSSLDPEEASGTAGGSDGLEEKVGGNNGSGRLGLLPSADDAFSPLCRFFGFPTSAEALLAEPGLLDAARRRRVRSAPPCRDRWDVRTYTWYMYLTRKHDNLSCILPLLLPPSLSFSGGLSTDDSAGGWPVCRAQRPCLGLGPSRRTGAPSWEIRWGPCCYD